MSRAMVRRAAWASAVLGLATVVMVALLVAGALGWVRGANPFVHTLMAVAIVPGAVLTFLGAWTASRAQRRR